MKKTFQALLFAAFALITVTSCSDGAVYHTVTIDYDIDFLSPYTITVKDGTVLYPPKDPVKEDYIFSAWKTADGKDYSFSSPVKEDVYIKAKWVPVTATVTLKDKNGNTIKTEKVSYGSTFTLPSDLGYQIASCTDSDGNSYTGEVKITRENMILTVTKGTYVEYSIGDIGPGGGYIVFDADNDDRYGITTSKPDGEHYSSNLGWRYLEAAKEDLDGKYVFGYYRPSGTNEAVVTSSDTESIGKGKTNTSALTALIGKTAYTTEDGSEKKIYAALAASSYENNGYSDWFLPSVKELGKLDNLVRLDKGSVKTGSENFYWSSSEEDAAAANVASFFTGGGYAGKDTSRSDELYVRPFRAF